MIPASADSFNHSFQSSRANSEDGDTSFLSKCSHSSALHHLPINESLLSDSYIAGDDEDGETGLCKEGELAGIPDMYSREYIGLYAQYAAIGLLYGGSGTYLPFCNYVYEGRTNVCANANSIAFFAWSIKIFFAIVTDTYRPFGLRRKPWMIFGWTGVLMLLMYLALHADKLDESSWLITLMVIQMFAMFSDVPADGYSVELGQLEPPEQRGQILATGQRVRFSFCIIAGIIQTTLLNGLPTNSEDCTISFKTCWSWGLNINQYYALIFAIILVLFVPICMLKERNASAYPTHTLWELFGEMWETMQNLTTLYLLIYTIGINITTNFVSNVNLFLQYNVIQLTNFQAGIDTISTYVSLVTAIYLFQVYLINRNWRTTQYASTLFSCSLGSLWILAYYDVGGLRDPWFTIFVDLDQNFAAGLSQVLFSLAVIEVAKPGLEATTYELIITVANASATLASILGTQLLDPLQCTACTDDDCSSNSVDVTSAEAFVQSDGPWRFTRYCLVLIGIGIAGCLVFAPFLPSGKEECKVWQARGEMDGLSKTRGYLTAALVMCILLYGLTTACLLLDSKTSCLAAVGGTGC